VINKKNIQRKINLDHCIEWRFNMTSLYYSDEVIHTVVRLLDLYVQRVCRVLHFLCTTLYMMPHAYHCTTKSTFCWYWKQTKMIIVKTQCV